MKSRKINMKEEDMAIANMRSMPPEKQYFSKETRAVKRKKQRDKNKKRKGLYKTL